jgi:hypothetical protein
VKARPACFFCINPSITQDLPAMSQKLAAPKNNSTLYIWLLTQPDTNYLGQYCPIVLASELATEGEILLNLDKLAQQQNTRCFELICQEDFEKLANWVSKDLIRNPHYIELADPTNAYRYVFTRFSTFCYWKRKGCIQIHQQFARI